MTLNAPTRSRAQSARAGLRPRDLQRARELYAEDFVDHVNALDFHGQDGIARSVALYRASSPTSRSASSTRRDRRRPRHLALEPARHPQRPRVTLPGITISRFEDGTIAEDWTVSDNLELLRRLGPLRGLALAARHLTRRRPGAR